jgi:hypothetical protein
MSAVHVLIRNYIHLYKARPTRLPYCDLRALRAPYNLYAQIERFGLDSSSAPYLPLCMPALY